MLDDFKFSVFNQGYVRDGSSFPEHNLASFLHLVENEGVLHLDDRLIGKTAQEVDVLEELDDLLLLLLFKTLDVGGVVVLLHRQEKGGASRHD